MKTYDDALADAGDALLNLAEGPGAIAAQALEEAFGQAGTRIEAALAQAARAGELDFSRMAEAILRDLSRMAAETALIASGIGGAGAGQTVNFNMQFAQGAATDEIMQSRGVIATALASAVASGGRFL